MELDLRPEGADAVSVAVHARPGASRDAVEGTHGDALAVRVRAVAEHGKANAAICRVIALAVGVPASAVEVVAGGGGKRKRVRIRGDVAAVSAALRGLAARST